MRASAISIHIDWDEPGFLAHEKVADCPIHLLLRSEQNISEDKGQIVVRSDNAPYTLSTRSEAGILPAIHIRDEGAAFCVLNSQIAPLPFNRGLILRLTVQKESIGGNNVLTRQRHVSAPDSSGLGNPYIFPLNATEIEKPWKHGLD